MSQDEATQNMRMKDEGYYASSPAIDGFDNPMDMSIRLSLGQRACPTPSRYDPFFTSETPPIFFDQSMSPRSQSSRMFDINDVVVGSPYDPDMNTFGFIDRPRTPIPGLQNPDGNSQIIPSRNDLPAYRPSFAGSRPVARNSFGFASASPPPDLTNPSADKTTDGSVSSPTLSSGKHEGRDHPFYRREREADGLYHSPMEAVGLCDFPPKAWEYEYHKPIDSHLKPFRCRKPGCVYEAFSSADCRVRHEREMHKMHNAEEFLCRYGGPCHHKQPGNGFSRSFYRGDHEKQVHHIFPEPARSKGRPKAGGEASNARSSLRRNSAKNNTSDESSTSTIGTVPTSPKPTRFQKHPAPVNAPLSDPYMDLYMPFPGGRSNFGSSPNTTLSPAQVFADFPGAKRARFSKTGVKSNSTHGDSRQECEQRWAEHARKLRDLVSSLPEAPDDSPNGLIHSIEQETRVLLSIYSDIDFSSKSG